jgi:putative aldouronate transport system substrate-binding protein
MKNIIRIIAVLAAVSVTLSCGSSDKGPPTLIWWMVGSTQPDFNESVKTISAYTEEKIGVRLEIRLAGWGVSDERAVTMINSGEYFDIMFVNGTNYNRFNELGAYADLTDLLPVEAPELVKYIPQVLWEGVKIKGRIYAVPTYKDSSVTGYYFWDHKFVEKYNIDLTQSGFPYLDQVFRRMKAGENNPRYYPFNLARSSYSFLFDDYDGLSVNLEPVGVRHTDQGRRVVNLLEQPDVLEKFRYLHAWYRDGIINPDANMVLESAKGRPFFMAQAWPSVAFSYAVAEGVEQYDPVRFYEPVYSTGSIQGSMNAISANSKYKQEALKLLQLINTDVKLRDMLHLGIEGDHFEYVNGGAAAKRLRTDWPLSNYQQGTYFIETPLDTVPAGYWDEVRAQNDSAFPSVMLGFMMDIQPIMNEVLNCRGIWDRYKQDLVVGASNPDTVIPQMMIELKNSGFDAIMAEAQRQVDSFK